MSPRSLFVKYRHEYHVFSTTVPNYKQYINLRTVTYTPPSISKLGKVFLHGVGHAPSKDTARNLAALKVIYQIEKLLDVPRGELRAYLDCYKHNFRFMSNEYHFIPYDRAIYGITWDNIPNDTSFVTKYREPATRSRHIEFPPEILKNEDALIAAKAITLASQPRAPTVDVHEKSIKNNDGTIYKRFASVRPWGGRIGGTTGKISWGAIDTGLSAVEAQVVSLTQLYNSLTIVTPGKKLTLHVIEKNQKMIEAMTREKHTSYGMAKLFVSLPLHQFNDLDTLTRNTPKFKKPRGLYDLPTESNLHQTLWDLVSQGLVEVDGIPWSTLSSSDIYGAITAFAEVEREENPMHLTPLGRAVNEFPVEPGVGRMLFMGLVLRAIDPALTIAALLSVYDEY